MNSMIYDPVEEFKGKYHDLHLDKTKKFFEELVARSGVNADENRQTVKEHGELQTKYKKLKRKFNFLRFLRVLMCITIILIPLVILRTTPKIKAMRVELEALEKEIAEKLALAHRQMQPLNDLFTDKDAISIIQDTIPLLTFAPCLSAEQETDMTVNYDFCDHDDLEQSTLDVLAGRYNDNPFVFEKKLTHKMGTHTYHGYKVITWTERCRGSNGKSTTRTRVQTLHASLVKPKPFYSTQVVLSYCAQGGPELSFTRDATNLDEKSDKQIDRYVRKGEKKLKKMTDEAIKENRDFTIMSNTDFEVLFDALDRTHEVQFRSLFTPLAQTNMVDLIRSKIGYGDDFHFIKRKRTNTIITEHSQGREITLAPKAYYSHSYDVICDNFIKGNEEFFKAVYFDFAPLWAIPIYQDRPVHSLKPIPRIPQSYSYKEYETLANSLDAVHVVHPNTKTQAILNSFFIHTENGTDEINISALSYDIIPRVDFVPVYGNDGRWHNVPVQWDDYIPLEANNKFFISTSELSADRFVLAKHNGLCIFN